MVSEKDLKKGVMLVNKKNGMKAKVIGKQADGYVVKLTGLPDSLLTPDNFPYWELLCR